jgi:asparagine synthase (glutamine-hydrolysing)
MCGIAGIFHLSTPKPVDPARVERMCDAIAHRGPDGQGVWTAPGVGLGHRRLSIIDLAGSPQPMASSDGRAMLVFNGEIYNYRELREELRKGGAMFHTDGDSEVILAAWQRWGVDCLPKLHGMFAFAIYDLDKRTLFLARDRLGVKPLFLASLADGSVIFGSELKALTAHPLLRREADPLAVEDYLTWGYVPDTRSILKGVQKLPAGHYLLLRHDASMPQPVQWWDVSFAERRKGSAADLEAELLHLLRQAVTSRMVADVPLGAFLSGGVDSSSVVALMAETSASPVKTCSIGFDVAALDETGYAKQIAERFHTDHRSRTVSQDDFTAIDDLAGVPARTRERHCRALGRRGGRGAGRLSAACLSAGRGPLARTAACGPTTSGVWHARSGLSQGRLGAACAARQIDLPLARREQRGGLCPFAIGDDP